jgi:hypothetical protein
MKLIADTISSKTDTLARVPVDNAVYSNNGDEDNNKLMNWLDHTLLIPPQG